MNYKYLSLLFLTLIKMSTSSLNFDYNVCNTIYAHRDNRTSHECFIAKMDRLRERDRIFGNGFPNLDASYSDSDDTSLIRNKRKIFDGGDDRILDLKVISELVVQCDKVDYKMQECKKSGRHEIYKYIFNLQNAFDSKEGITLLNKCLIFLDFSIYHNLRSFEKNEALNFLDIISSINWGTEIDDVMDLTTILYHISQISSNANYKFRSVEISESIVVMLENIYSNILKWKITTNIVNLTATCLQLMTCVIENGDEYSINRVYSLFIFLNNLIKNNVFWQEDYELIKIRNYFYFLKYIPEEKLSIFDGMYKNIEPNSIFNSQVIMKFDTFTLDLYTEKNLPVNEIKQSLVDVYEKFKSIFGKMLQFKDPKAPKKLTAKIFSNYNNYKNYGNPLFGISTSNGGVTMPWKNDIVFFCYGEDSFVRNLGHEFVHALGFLFFGSNRDDHASLVEGLAEAIGQTSISQIVNNYDELKKIEITKEHIIEASYTSSPTCYPLGMVFVKNLIDNNRITDVYQLMHDYDRSNFESLIDETLPQIKKMVQNYDTKKDYNTVQKKIMVSFVDVYKENYPGSGITIETDNTVFDLHKDTIFMSYSDSRRKNRNPIDLFKNYKVHDVNYLISKTVELSPKFFDGYELIFNKYNIYDKDLIIKKNNVLLNVGDNDLSNIINSFFKMAIRLDIKYIKENSFEEVKNIILNKKYFTDVRYKEILTPESSISFNEMKMVYDIQTAEYIDMNLVKQIDDKKIITKNNKNIKELFDFCFNGNLYDNEKIVGFRRKRDTNYLNLNGNQLDSIELIFDKTRESSKNEIVKPVPETQKNENKIIKSTENKSVENKSVYPIINQITEEMENINNKMPGKINMEIKTKVDILDSRITDVQNTLKKLVERNNNVITERKLDHLFNEFTTFLENDSSNKNKINDYINKINSELLVIKNNVNGISVSERNLNANIRTAIEKNEIISNSLGDKISTIGNNVAGILEKNVADFEERMDNLENKIGRNDDDNNIHSFVNIEDKLKKIQNNLDKKDYESQNIIMKINKFLEEESANTERIQRTTNTDNNDDKPSFFSSYTFIFIIALVFLIIVIIIFVYIIKKYNRNNNNKTYVDSLKQKLIV